MKKSFKQICAVLACIVIAASISVGAFAASYVVGDANSDGKVTAADVLIIRKYLAKWQNLSMDEKAADVNGDSKVTAADVLMIRKYLAKWFDSFPVEPEEEDPVLDVEVPSDYPTNEVSAIAINQIGYTPDSNKIARITATARKDTYDCYVVNAETGKVVYTATSESALNIGTISAFVSKFDFSSVKKEGSYYIATPLGRSYTFVIDSNPYAELQDKLTTALYYNRCGTALDSSIVGSFYAHAVCHNDTNHQVHFLTKLVNNTYYEDTSISATAADFSGGLHDAGDYGRYTVPANGFVAQCLFAYELFPDGATTDVVQDNANENISDFLDEARYEMQWLLKMQDSSTGGVYFRIGTRKHAAYVMPEYDDQYNSGGLYLSRTMVIPTGGFAGNAAACYTIFKNIDPTFAKQCLTAAKKAYEYVEKNIGDGTETFTGSSENPTLGIGEYGATTNFQSYMYAASALYRATGEAKYNTKFKELYAAQVTDATYPINITTIDGYNTVGAATISYLLNDKADAAVKADMIERIGARSEEVAAKINKDKYGSSLIGEYYWGSNNLQLDNATPMIMYDYFTGTDKYIQQIRAINDFLLGCNFTEYSFVTGVGSNAPKNPHHRQSMLGVDAGYECVPGMLVGGPYQNSGYATLYIDDRYDYFTNEMCIYWNSNYMFTVAYLVDHDVNA